MHYEFLDEVKATTTIGDFFQQAGFTTKQKSTLNFWLDIIILSPNEGDTLNIPKTTRTKRSRQDLRNANTSLTPSPPRKNKRTIKQEVKEEVKEEIKAVIKVEIKGEVKEESAAGSADDLDDLELIEKADET